MVVPETHSAAKYSTVELPPQTHSVQLHALNAVKVSLETDDKKILCQMPSNSPPDHLMTSLARSCDN